MPSAAEINFISVSDVVTCEIKQWHNFKIISAFYFRRKQLWWLHVI